MPSECGRMRPTLRGKSTEQSAARSCGRRRSELPPRGFSVASFELYCVYHGRTFVVPTSLSTSLSTSPPTSPPTSPSTSHSTSPHGATPEILNLRRWRVKRNVPRNRLCLAAVGGLLEPSTSTRNCRLHSKHTPQAAATLSLPAPPLACQFHRHTAAARGCVSE